MQMNPAQQTEIDAILKQIRQAEAAQQQLIGKITSWYRGHTFKLEVKKEEIEVMFASCADIYTSGNLYVDVMPRNTKGKWGKRPYRVNFKELV